MKYAAAMILLMALAGCAKPTPPKPMEFLTREGCVQTKMMQFHLDKAITAIGKPMPYTVVNLDTLDASDARRGYPTPTILRGGADLFGMPTPTPPFPEPT